MEEAYPRPSTRDEGFLGLLDMGRNGAEDVGMYGIT